MFEACERCGLHVQSVDLFAAMPLEETNKLTQLMDHERLDKGSTLFSPEDIANRMIIIRRGKVKITNFDENGKEYISQILTESSSIGEEKIFTGSPFGSYGIALTDVHICSITLKALEQFLESDPKFSVQFIKVMGKKLAESQQMNQLFTVDDVKHRLGLFLVMRTEQTGHNVIELTRDTIASAIHVTRETVSRKLNELEDEGWIELIGYKKIKILDKEALRLGI